MNLMYATGNCFSKWRDTNYYTYSDRSPRGDPPIVDLLVLKNLSKDQDDNIEERHKKDKERWKADLDRLKKHSMYKNAEIIVLYSGGIDLDGTLEGMGITSDSDLKLVPIKIQLIIGLPIRFDDEDFPDNGYLNIINYQT